jgi:hypothetical protein
MMIKALLHRAIINNMSSKDGNPLVHFFIVGLERKKERMSQFFCNESMSRPRHGDWVRYFITST